jgi:exoribonuclease II
MKYAIDLAQLATQIMPEKGLEPEFSQAEMQQLAKIVHTAPPASELEDLSSLLWCSIDNDDSLDLDQLTCAEKKENGATLWIAVADVDAVVAKDTPIDAHAKINTTSVYTPAKLFPMLPEKLSTNLTSLNENEERIALVTKIDIDQAGDRVHSSIIRAVVRNRAKLAYSGVGAWLEGKGPLPDKVREAGLEDNLKLQSDLAQLLRRKRHAAGSLTLESPEAEVRMVEEQIAIEIPAHNLAHQLIEEFMIAANRVMAQVNVPVLRRVVRVPKNWGRIMEVANSYGDNLPLGIVQQ